MPDRLHQYEKNPQTPGKRPQRSDLSPSNGAFVGDDLDLHFPTMPNPTPPVDTTNTYEGVKGNNPAGRQAVPGPQAEPLTGNRTKPTPGAPGPM